jgi:6,7-dimethyl-8-ribityllumazine synthase
LNFTTYFEEAGIYKKYRFFYAGDLHLQPPNTIKMASKGNKKLNVAEEVLNIGGAKVVVIKTAWNSPITDELANGCRKVLEAKGAEMVELIVPGAVELTFAVRHHMNKHSDIHAYIVLGCVIRGDTPHFDYVCQSVTQGITHINATMHIPVIFGVLTVDTEEQALQRIGGRHGHKGEEAALTALQMIDFSRQL